MYLAWVVWLVVSTVQASDDVPTTVTVDAQGTVAPAADEPYVSLDGCCRDRDLLRSTVQELQIVSARLREEKVACQERLQRPERPNVDDESAIVQLKQMVQVLGRQKQDLLQEIFTVEDRLKRIQLRLFDAQREKLALRQELSESCWTRWWRQTRVGVAQSRWRRIWSSTTPEALAADLQENTWPKLPAFLEHVRPVVGIMCWIVESSLQEVGRGAEEATVWFEPKIFAVVQSICSTYHQTVRPLITSGWQNLQPFIRRCATLLLRLAQVAVSVWNQGVDQALTLLPFDARREVRLRQAQATMSLRLALTAVGDLCHVQRMTACARMFWEWSDHAELVRQSTEILVTLILLVVIIRAVSLRNRPRKYSSRALSAC